VVAAVVVVIRFQMDNQVLLVVLVLSSSNTV
jgi:hypothetical protein